MSNHTLEIRIDRRWDGASEVADELRSIVATIQGLDVEWVDVSEFENAPDAARFRDFATFARLRHTDAPVLEWVTEELVETFGWRIDVAPLE